MLAKLKPVLGQKKADQLYLAWHLEPALRPDIEKALRVLAVKCLQESYESQKILLDPPKLEESQGKYTLGTVYYGDEKAFGEFGLRDEELAGYGGHVAIFGRTGSGKSTLSFWFIHRLLEHGKPFLLCEWKRTARNLLPLYPDKKIYVYTVGRSLVPFHFNPLIPPPNTETTVWIKKIIDVLCHAYFLGEGVAYLLLKALDKVYREQDVPTFEALKHTLEQMKPKGREALWWDSTMRAVGTLCYGNFGNVLNSKTSYPLQELLQHNVILELDSLNDSDKVFFISSLLLSILHYRLQESTRRENFQHAIFVDEAQRVFRAKPDYDKSEPVTDTVLREIRELNECVVLSAQHSSMISRVALANPYTTISLSLKEAHDVDAIANCMLLDKEQKQYLGKLDVGWALVKLQGRFPKPFLIKVEKFNIEKGSVTDEMVKERMRGFYEQNGINVADSMPKEEIRCEERTEKENPPISENEKIFLQDIIEHPFSGLVERYRRLELNVYQGNKLRDTLIQKEFIETVNVPTPNGRLKVLQLTEKGKEILNLPPQERRGGVHHEYYKEQAAEHFRNKGYIVIKEYPIGAGKTVDVVAMNETERVAVEVETGKSDHVYNIQKCLPHFDKIISLVLDEKTKIELQAAFQNEPKVQILSPREFFASA